MFEILTREENDQLFDRLGSAARKYHDAARALAGTSAAPGIMAAWQDNTDLRVQLNRDFDLIRKAGA